MKKIKDNFVNSIKKQIKIMRSPHSDYIRNIKQNKFVNLYNFGSSSYLGSGKIDFTQESHAIFCGSLGSGKTVAGRQTFYTLFLQHQNDIFFVFDPMKGANDFRELSDHKQSFRITDYNNIIKCIDLLYLEMKLREKQTNNISNEIINNSARISKIHIAIEEAHSFMQMIQINRQSNVAGTTAYKITEMLEKGRKYGFYFLFLSQIADSAIFPNHILKNISHHLMFRHHDSMGFFFNINSDSSRFKPGQCVSNKYNEYQFSYISDDEFKDIFEILKKETHYDLMIFRNYNKEIQISLLDLIKDREFEKLLLHPSIPSDLIALSYPNVSSEAKTKLRSHPNWKNDAELILDLINKV